MGRRLFATEDELQWMVARCVNECSEIALPSDNQMRIGSVPL